MELNNTFTVPVPVEQAWAILTDVERIAPCLPGAQLQEVEGDEYRGIVKIKVGPITAQYTGKATFVERDDEGHRAVLRAEGRDTRGQGNASATIVATLTEDPASGGVAATTVSVVTDLTVSGKVAQFGRGVLADVSAKLIGQFVQCLEADVLSSMPADGVAVTPPLEAPTAADPAPGVPLQAAPGVTAEPEEQRAAAPTAPEPAVRRVSAGQPEPEAIDLIGTAGSPILKRAAPLLGALGFLLALFVLRRARR